MELLCLLSLLLANGLFAPALAQQLPPVIPSKDSGVAAGDFVQRKGTRLVTSTGKPYYFSGMN